MRAFNKAVDKFCLTHRRFGIPRLMLYIIIGTAAVYLIPLLVQSYAFLGLITFDPAAILRGEIWRLVTWVFIPTTSQILFEALLLYFYYFIGNTLEREWGTAKFTIYYLFGILINVIYGFAVWLISGQSLPPSLDSSYLNLSMFFAFAVLFPEQRVLLFFIIPIKIKWLALLDAAYFLFQIASTAIAGQFAYAFLPLVAILNFFLFCGDDLVNLIRPYRARNTRQAINFRKAAKQVRHQESRPYRHKCAVCGKTDAEYPNLEFRYCSRCNGYHCFCIDHINNHVHFQ